VTSLVLSGFLRPSHINGFYWILLFAILYTLPLLKKHENVCGLISIYEEERKYEKLMKA